MTTMVVCIASQCCIVARAGPIHNVEVASSLSLMLYNVGMFHAIVDIVYTRIQ